MKREKAHTRTRAGQEHTSRQSSEPEDESQRATAGATRSRVACARLPLEPQFLAMASRVWLT